MTKEVTCCFTGHRPNKFDFGYKEDDPKCVKIKELLSEYIEVAIAEGFTTFISGLALGVDMWAAEAVIKLKEEFPHIRLIAAIPCQGQEKRWPKESQERYQAILEKADDSVLVTDGPYTPQTMIARDEWMVDHSDRLIAVFDGSRGGTKHTFDNALSKGIEIVRIHPQTLKVEFPVELSDEKREYRLSLLRGSLEGEKRKVLQCHSKGDKRFSALYAKVSVHGKKRSIEEHYQLAKRFGEEVPKTIKEAKGRKPTHMEIETENGSVVLDADFLTPWYKLLWVKYFIENPDLLAYARQFDEFEDIFRGKNTINCQADVIEEIVKRGTKAVTEDCRPLILELEANKNELVGAK